VDRLGRPLHVHLTAGNIRDISEAPTLIAAAQGKSFIADKGYDSNAVVDAVKERHMKVVIPPKSNRKDKRKFSRKPV
jgi:transposase